VANSFHKYGYGHLRRQSYDRQWVRLLLLLVVSLLVATVAIAAEPIPEDISVAGRIKRLQDYPCMECHRHIESDGEATSLPLKQPHHRMVFRHMRTEMKCGRCHPVGGFDELMLVDGKRVSFDKSHLVCGQCHAEKHRDWNWNIHGKVIGAWNGVKVRYACVDCHPAHVPAFAPMRADPPPQRPKFSIPKREH